MQTGPQPWTLTDAPSIQVTLPSAEGAPGAARRLVAELADRLPSQVLADLRTIVSELVTNSVVHGTGADVDLCVEVTSSGDVRARVSDGGTRHVGIGPPRPSGEGGLGLRIVDALASRWGVDAPSSDVWFDLCAPRLAR